MTRRDWTGRVFIGMSLDGYIARKDGDIAWLTNPQKGEHTKIASDHHTISWNEFYPSVDYLVIGRGTFEKVLTFDSWPYTDKKVIVMSTTLQQPQHGITIVRSLEEAVDQLERGNAKSVYVDGGKVIQSFMRADLIDEITVGIAPVLIGEGLSLFGYIETDCWLDLKATSSNESGMVSVTYSVRRKD
jgi:dihydrofolate reductase